MVCSDSSRRSTGSRVDPAGRVVDVVAGQEGHQLADQRQALLLAVRREVGDAGGRVVRGRPAQLLGRDLLVRHRADDVGAGHEHVGGVLHHRHEVGDGRRVDGPARARPHDGRDLGDDPGGQRVAQEDVGVAGQRDDPLLDAGAARVVEADDGHARLHGQVHHLADLAGVGLGQRSPEDGEVLREHEHRAAVDPPRAGDDAVAGDLLVLHAEVVALVHHEAVDLEERARVQQQLQPLAGGLLAGLVLAPDPLLATTEFGQSVTPVQLLETVRGRHGITVVG